MCSVYHNRPAKQKKKIIFFHELQKSPENFNENTTYNLDELTVKNWIILIMGYKKKPRYARRYNTMVATELNLGTASTENCISFYG